MVGNGLTITLTVPLEEPHPPIYRLLRETLERLAIPGADCRGVEVHFMLRLLRLTGFQPQLDDCTGCGSAVHATGFWSARQGGLLCGACLHEDPSAEPAVPAMLEALEALSEADHPISEPAPFIMMLRQRVAEFLRWRLDHPLKTLVE